MKKLELRMPFESIEEISNECIKHKDNTIVFDIENNEHKLDINQFKVTIDDVQVSPYEIFPYHFKDGCQCGSVRFEKWELKERISRLYDLLQNFLNGHNIVNKDGNKLVRISEINLNNVMNYKIDDSLYRPFKSKRECVNEIAEHCHFASLESIDDEKIYSILKITNTYIQTSNGVSNFEDAFKKYKFLDGEPFGIKDNYNIIYC